MKEKDLIRLGASVARELINMLEKDLVGKEKKEKTKNVKRKKVSNLDRSHNSSS